MVSNPKFGWCQFKLGDFEGTPSYLTDVPVDLLDAFLDYYEKGVGVAVFDEEGSHFTLVMTSYNLGVFIIEEKEFPRFFNLCNLKVDNLAKELVSDIENNVDGWVAFLTDDDQERMNHHKNEIMQKIAKLKQCCKYD